LNFNRNSSNIGCFGGSVIDHPALVPEIYNNAKNVILFGTGIMSQENLLFNRRISYEIYPRGYETEKCLKELCIESYGVVGDTAFLLSIEPKIKNSFKNIVGILDAYKKNDLPIKCDSYIAVAKTERTNGYKVYCDLKEYIKLLHNVSVIVSSQIHPSIIAGALGVSAIMIKKDIRFNDIIGVINPRYSVDKEIYFFTEKDREKMYDICSYSWQTNFFKMLSKYVVRE
jgi:hypothetical protein